jgi:hypothetical protein
MINLALICVILSQKPPIVLAFSMIWFKSSDFHQVHDPSIHHLIKFTTRFFRWPFLKFVIQMKNFLACQQMLAKLTLKWWSYDWFWSNFRSSSSDFHQVHDSQVWFSSSSSFKFSNAAFWNFAYRRKIFRVCQSVHTEATQQLDRKYYRKKCFDRIKLDQIRSNQIKSNQIRSDQACLHRLMRHWERQSRCVLYEEISIRSLWLSLMSIFVRCKEWDSIERILMKWSRSFWS